MKQNVCCFFGHRKVNITTELKNKLYHILEKLIIDKDVNTFLFGSKSQFDTLCYKVICELKMKYPYIKRIYVRAEFPHISLDYYFYFLEQYEETYYPDGVVNAGKLSYIKRNFEMINNSIYCVVYYDKNYLPAKRKSKSGTEIAYNYAQKKKKIIINVLDLCEFF